MAFAALDVRSGSDHWPLSVNRESSQISRDHTGDGLPIPRRYWSAVGIWLAVTMAVLDGAIANVALPVIGRELGASPASSVWVINAYQLTITMLLLPLAALGDRVGYKSIYLPGLALFTVGSVGCAIGGTLDLLVAARIFQGVGAACIMSMNTALVRATYPAAMLGRGIGYNAMVLSVAAAIGPTLASLILAVATWQWLFLINLPIGIAALIVGYKALPDPHGHGQPFDWGSAILSAAMMGLIVSGAELFARESSMIGIAMIAAGVGAGALLVWRAWGDKQPLMPLDLLRIPVFTMSMATSVVSFAAQMLAYVAIPFLLQSVLGRSVLATGLLMTPWPLAVGIAAPFAGRLADRFNAGLLGGIGLAIFAAGLFLLSRMGASPDNLQILWRMAVCGIGFGLFQSPNNRTIVSAAPKSRSGAAGGMLATARLLGQTAGAVTVGVGFHLAGITVAPALLFAASIAALVAAGISMLRLTVAPPGRVAVYRPILD